MYNDNILKLLKSGYITQGDRLYCMANHEDIIIVAKVRYLTELYKFMYPNCDIVVSKNKRNNQLIHIVGNGVSKTVNLRGFDTQYVIDLIISKTPPHFAEE